MPKSSPVCPKCQRPMERGYIADVGRNKVIQGRWSRGEPIRNFFGGIKWREKETIPVVTYRCTGCDYLESYAPLV